MEIKINKGLADLYDVNSLDDHKKIFLAVVSLIYEKLPMDHYIFFDTHDMDILTGIRVMDPNREYSKKQHPWFFEMFDYQFRDYQNMGIRPKKLSFRWGRDVAGKPQHSIEITDQYAINMWWYLLGTFHSLDTKIVDFELRDVKLPSDSWSIDRSYVGHFNKRMAKRDYNWHD